MEIFQFSQNSGPLLSSLHALSAFYLRKDNAKVYRHEAFASLRIEMNIRDLKGVLGTTLLLLQYAVRLLT